MSSVLLPEMEESIDESPRRLTFEVCAKTGRVLAHAGRTWACSLDDSVHVSELDAALPNVVSQIQEVRQVGSMSYGIVHSERCLCVFLMHLPQASGHVERVFGMVMEFLMHDGRFTDLRQLLSELDGAENPILVLDENLEVNLTTTQVPAILGEDPIGRSFFRYVNGSAKRLEHFRAGKEGPPLYLDGEAEVDGRAEPVPYRLIRVPGGSNARDLFVGVVGRRNIRSIEPKRFAWLGYTDALTGLPSEEGFRRTGNAILAEPPGMNSHFAVILVDIDQFAGINETYGHGVGDRVLQTVAHALERVDGASAVGRLGPDTFGLWVVADSEAELEQTIGSIQKSVTPRSVDIDGVEVAITLSAGHVRAPWDRATVYGVHGLIRRASVALTRARESGQGLWQPYQHRMTHDAMMGTVVRSGLHRALNEGQLCVHYQPIYHLQNGTIVGFESLVRWKHPSRGMLSAHEFIASAVEEGVIGAIDHWVLKKAAANVAEASKERGVPLFLAANFSAPQFAQSGFGQQVLEILDISGLAPENLVVELTEQVALEKVPATFESLAELKAAGVRLALDDFGSGHASLNSFRSLNCDVLKVDQYLTSGLPDNAQDRKLFSGLQMIARGYCADLAVEGVQNSDQVTYFRNAGVTYGQGNHLAAPGPIESFF